MMELQYKTPSVQAGLSPALRSYWFRIAIVCWVVPLVAGLVIFGWFEAIRPAGMHLYQVYGHGVVNKTPVTRQMARLIDYGLLDLLLGATLAFYGVISLIVFAMLRWGRARHRARQIVGPAVVVLGLIISNFIVAVILIQVANR